MTRAFYEDIEEELRGEAKRKFSRADPEVRDALIRQYVFNRAWALYRRRLNETDRAERQQRRQGRGRRHSRKDY